MAFNDQNGMSPADMAAVLGNGSNNGWGGFGGDGAWWIFILFLFAANNGWGNGFGGNGGGAYPYMMATTTDNDIQRGFDQQAVMSSLNGITSAVSNGFANAEVSRCNAQANLLQTLNANNNAVTSNMNALAMSLQNCCCENRAGLADLKYTIATEACSDRAAVTDGVRDIIANNTANTQAILDKMCQQEIDALKTQNANLQTQLNIEALRSSQADQTAAILANNAAQTQALEQYLNPAPVPAYVVQNPNCCVPNYNACGCNG
jgi:hypothetical protein